MIEYYGYIPEMHKVTTEDGYILTVFRCNSKKTAIQANRKAVIVQHGLLGSSDDFCINDPSQGLGIHYTLTYDTKFVFTFILSLCH